MKAGDIWLAQLDPTVGSEIQKTRHRHAVESEHANLSKAERDALAGLVDVLVQIWR